MSGDLYIRSLYDPDKELNISGSSSFKRRMRKKYPRLATYHPYLYHAPEQGVFHCHYIYEQLSFFGITWEDIFQKHARIGFRRGRAGIMTRAGYVDGVGRRRGKRFWYLPTHEIQWLLAFLEYREPQHWQPTEPDDTEWPYRPFSEEKYTELCLWRDSLCRFLRVALERKEVIIAAL